MIVQVRGVGSVGQGSDSGDARGEAGRLIVACWVMTMATSTGDCLPRGGSGTLGLFSVS